MAVKTSSKAVRHTLYGGEVVIDFYPGSHRFKLIEGGNKEIPGNPISVTGATGIVDKSRPLLLWANRLIGSYMRQYLEERAGQKFTAEELYPVIDEALAEPDKKKEEAAANGTVVHDFALAWALWKLGRAPKPEINADWNEQIINGINAFIDWQTVHNVEFVEAERVIYSRRRHFVGFTDVLARVDGLFTIVDYKTSKSVYSDQQYQLSGYWDAFMEEMSHSQAGGLPILAGVQQGLIAHFDKETGLFTPYLISEEEHKKNLEAFEGCLIVKRREKELNPDRW